GVYPVGTGTVRASHVEPSVASILEQEAVVSIIVVISHDLARGVYPVGTRSGRAGHVECGENVTRARDAESGRLSRKKGIFPRWETIGGPEYDSARVADVIKAPRVPRGLGGDGGQPVGGVRLKDWAHHRVDRDEPASARQRVDHVEGF